MVVRPPVVPYYQSCQNWKQTCHLSLYSVNNIGVVLAKIFALKHPKDRFVTLHYSKHTAVVTYNTITEHINTRTEQQILGQNSKY